MQSVCSGKMIPLKRDFSDKIDVPVNIDLLKYNVMLSITFIDKIFQNNEHNYYEIQRF